MTLDEARKILGVSIDATRDDLKKRYRRLASEYHPDKGRYTDGKHFTLINTAYMLLTAEAYGIDKVKGVPTEVAEAIDIRNAIHQYLDTLLVEFKELRSYIESDLLERIESDIDSAKSKSALKQVLTRSVTAHLSELRATLKSFVKDIRGRVASDKNDFLFRLFSEMYEERRKYWLLNLWKNPILLFDAASFAGVFAGRGSGYLKAHYPAFWESVMSSLAPLIVLCIGALALGIDYYRLSPRRQFVPPRLSLDGLHALLADRAKSLPMTDTELGVGGGVVGGMVGTVIFPIVGTVIGGGLGYLVGSLFGKSLAEMKREITVSIRKEVHLGGVKK